MMRMPAVFAILCLGLYAACSAQTPQNPPAGTDTKQLVAPNPATGTRHIPPIGTTPSGPPTVYRPPAYAITDAKLAKPDTLEVSYQAGYVPCNGKLGKVEVRETPDHVSITLHRVYPRPPNPRRPCPQYLAIKWTTVKLDQPLGKRTVVDGSTGKTITVQR